MQKKFTPSLLFSAVLTALASVSTFASAAPNHYVDWNGSDIPTINNKHEISSEEADQHANGESWFAVLDVNNDATGTLEDLDLTVKENLEIRTSFYRLSKEDKRKNIENKIHIRKIIMDLLSNLLEDC